MNSRKTHRIYQRIAIMTVVILCLFGIAAADPYVGGIPLTTVQSGSVSGGVYIDADNDWWPADAGPQTATHSFDAIPNVNDIAWARLYVSVYCGHMQNNYQGTATVSFDGNGDGDYTDAGEALGTETMNVAYTYPNPVTVNDHMNRVTSDYLMWYDVTSLITSQTPSAQVATAALDGSFDGRIKMITLVVAYNDGDMDTVYYLVNQGHDTDTYYDTTGYVGYTEFDLSGYSGTVESATLTVNHMASSDGSYAWYGDSIDTDPATGNFQGAYFGYNIWDLTDVTYLGGIYDLTYDRTDQFFKIPLAILEVKKETVTVAPVADFSATPLSGITPLDVQFNDLSTGPPTSWTWRYAYKPLGGSYGSYTTFSNEQNPSYTFSNVGDYSIRLTVSNSVGSNTKSKTGYITVSAPPEYDLEVTGISPNGNPDTLFAREENPVAITITNNGGTITPATTVSLTTSDGFSATVDVPAIAGSSSTTLTITDGTVRDTAEGAVTYTATVDPSNTVAESDETNNQMATEFTVTYNGYKGKRYWSGGSDVITRHTFDLNGGLLNSSGDSTYHSGSVTGSGWSAYTVTWTSTDLPVPSGATIEAAYLYVPYTWDSSDEMPDRFHITFNGNELTPLRHSEDMSNFGAYPNHDYGLLTYDVTSLFDPDGNSAYLTKDDANTNVAMYGLTLAVVYEDATESRKQIFLNDEFDLLGASATNYATSEEEATAYVPFSGMTIVPGDASLATLITFVPSGNGPEGDLLFNGAAVASDVWDYGLASGTQVAVDTQDVLSGLLATGNEAGIRSTDEGSTTCMAASHAFLVVDYSAAPVAAFSGTPTSGYAPLTVQFTDESTNSPTSWSWDFGDGGTSGDQNPSHIYTSAGTFTVSLTATNADGSGTETKAGYISTTGMPVPVAAFSATPRVGTGPLSVTFTDTSTNSPTSWIWEYREVESSSWTEFNTTQNPIDSFPAGTYDIRLTATNAGGSGTETKNTYIASSAGRLPLTTVQSGIVSGDLYVGAFQPVPWSSQSSTPGLKEFTQVYTIPTFTDIQWARLYTSIYAAGTDDRAGSATMSFDGNGNGVYTDAGEELGTDALNVMSTGDHNAYTVNDHGTRVYSDYLLWYDVTSLITNTSPSAKLVTENVDSSTFDGRVKTLTLVVAYNDGDTDQVKYWVNEGHDYQSATDPGTSTTYATESLTSGWASAELTHVHLSSKDATYTFNSGTVTGADPLVGYNYFGKNVWDVTSGITVGSGSTLAFTHATDNSYKTPLSTLKVRYPTPAPVAAFTASPATGDRPLEVTFTDASTGSITNWDLDFGDGSTHGSGTGPWTHTYTTRDTFTATLTVTGPGGSTSDTETITVNEPAPAVTFIANPTSGTEPLLVDFAATNTGGEVTSWKWESSPAGMETWTEFATIEDPQDISFNDGTYDIRVTATGPDYSDVETQGNCISVGGASITVGVSQGSIIFGAMQAGVDSTGQTQVTVTTDGGTSWSVMAADGKTENKGHMVSGTTALAGAFQLSNDGGSSYNPLTSAITFMSGSGAGTWNENADVKQAIATADAPGEYAITVTFTGAFA